MELFKEGMFSYRVLTPDRRDEALILLARAFCSEPNSSAVAKTHPEMTVELHDWVEFHEYSMEGCSSNGLSVIAVDTDSGRLAGVFIVRDLLEIPPGFKEKYTSDANVLSPLFSFCLYLDAKASEKMPELCEPGKAVDLWCLGVHPDYRGHGIANYLTSAVLPLCRKAGYKYATIEALNAWTSKSAQWNNFTAVHVEEARNWLWKGEALYSSVEPPHGSWTFWVKDLQQEQNSTEEH